VLRAALDGVALRLAAIVKLLEPFLDEETAPLDGNSRGGGAGKQVDTSATDSATTDAATAATVEVGNEGKGATLPLHQRAASSTRRVALWASGGALSSSVLWRQIIADATGRPVVASAESGTETLTGCAVLAIEALAAPPATAPRGGCDNFAPTLDAAAMLAATATTTAMLRGRSTVPPALFPACLPAGGTGSTTAGCGATGDGGINVVLPRLRAAAPPYAAMAAAQDELYAAVLGPTSDFKCWYGEGHGN
jgi:hypothetical protein